ncbi:PREDICTED: UPF0764 protein C16orf89 homolog [Dufourea novaeangliae]|uniref:UPF0764 protein C16orf89 homolog n=1 Tax=Dufourea novaeangliae TaxID=178035 RepID=UPI000767634E|nr:PREDICTED: UPF0764 protein C16orf89 homolog [Dufourea novaeangliae]
MDGLRVFTGTWAALLLCGFSPWVYGKFISDNFEDKLTALSKVVDYIHQRPGQMNADATFSVTIVEANIAATLLDKNAQYLEEKYWSTLMRMLKLCDQIRRYLLDRLVPESEDVRLLHDTLNNPALWMKHIFWQDGVLQRGSETVDLTYQDIRDLIMQGTPKEEESDQCLGEIVRNNLKSHHQMPEVCIEILMRRDLARGYPLTHRLLIIQVAQTLSCERGLPVRSSDLILSYCSSILRDLVDVEAAGFPYQTPDLMMEQVLLCGMEGFLEFTGGHYERLVLAWAHPSGCFSSFGNKYAESPLRMVRRASTPTDFGCDSHATGLAAASLSLFVRENVENLFT